MQLPLARGQLRAGDVVTTRSRVGDAFTTRPRVEDAIMTCLRTTPARRHSHYSLRPFLGGRHSHDSLEANLGWETQSGLA
jgi:hypothetical protein